MRGGHLFEAGHLIEEIWYFFAYTYLKFQFQLSLQQLCTMEFLIPNKDNSFVF